MSSKSDASGFTTTNLHADRRDHPEHGVLHKPVHTSVAFTYDDAHDLAAVFQGKKPGYNYGRQQNPTVNALQNRITKMEQGLTSTAFATGMAAIGSALFALLRPGDHIISSAFLFGNTNSLLNSFRNFGIDVSFVDTTRVENVEAALTPATRLVFTETIANPVTQVADLKLIGQLCASKGIIYMVDNTMTSPWLFRPAQVGASLIVNSLTKYIGGHGNALGGMLTDTGLYDWEKFPNILDLYRQGDVRLWGTTQIRKKGLRDFGATLGPEAAHHLAVGSETLPLRMDRAADNAQRLAEFCESHPRIKKVYYPGLTTHPQHQLARTLFRKPGAIMSIDLQDDLDCFDFLNQLDCVIASSNLGDTRTLAIPVAHTIFYEMGAERRASMGIGDNMIRLSVGIEDIDDLLNDFEQALK
ncbi:cystathionine gamma-synthase family protein [Pseudohongiella spirulinae]|uniref:Putative O-acetylhomoserine aminocarboxypropyltransferase n=1 Tax=Pseudohongiella spirulinae TaxID=1249552 RepID=A0A0S2KF97_9GAMM|nr:cystathionine gamma-synthase family protein [Pseudohongiella spirulinae]ALO46984.1 Putative O-acetylhomoserine aminocarboxypropyltransferase [Pseudohongiella spirulinae]